MEALYVWEKAAITKRKAGISVPDCNQAASVQAKDAQWLPWR